MKIALIGSVSAYTTETFYKRAFESMGHQVSMFDEYVGIRRQFPNRMLVTRFRGFGSARDAYPINGILLKSLYRERPDLVLVFKGVCLSDSTIRALTANFPTYLLYPDAYRYPSTIREWLYSGIFSEATRLDFHRRRGAKETYTLFQACDPEVHMKQELEKRYPVSFIGSMYPDRARMLRGLPDLHIFGNYWYIPVGVRHKGVFGLDYVSTINRSEILLNIQHPIHLMADAPHARVFEVAGSGGCLVSSDMPCINRLFPRIATFRGREELRAVVKVLRNNPLDAAERAAATMEACRTSHTYRHRAEEILASIR